MTLPRGIAVGIGVSVLGFLFGVLLFFQTHDPMLLVFSGQLVVMGWVVALIVHLLRHGIPVRILRDEREP